MTTAAGNLAEKKDEKVEKRRALGRGLASLLPGPRVVGPDSRGPSLERGGDGSRGDAGEQQVPHFVRNDKSEVRNDKTENFDTSVELRSVQQESSPRNVVVSLALDSIEKNPYQTRQVFEEEALVDLAGSIKEHGVVQPVVVRPGQQQGSYILVLGERRLRASKMAGKDTIPASVRHLSPQQAAEMTVLENVQREDLNSLEQAQAFRVLSQEFHLTQAQIAERIGVSRETVANYMRLLRLPEKVKGYMLEDRLNFSDARELLRLENEEHIVQVAEEIVNKRLKWDEIEERVMRLNGSFAVLPGQAAGTPKKGRGARWIDPNVRAAQMEMERTLGMRVRIRDRNGKGRIVIEYASVDDYERVVEMLGKK
ncbi:MAG: ParB/RepB/Spo0J family partition protein [Candidatus Sulfotelmatobacter sp.]|jgi:ParB family chromosome partitioning protein